MRQPMKKICAILFASLFLIGIFGLIMICREAKKHMDAEKMLNVVRFIGWFQEPSFYNDIKRHPDGYVRWSEIEHNTLVFAARSFPGIPGGNTVPPETLEEYLICYYDKCYVEKRGDMIVVSVIDGELSYTNRFSIDNEGYSNQKDTIFLSKAQREETRKNPSFFAKEKDLPALRVIRKNPPPAD